MKRISLNGLWDFVADLDPKQHNERRYRAYTQADVNRRHWLKAPVPGCWNKYAERYDIFEGVCWFSRAFEAPAVAEGSAARLRFAAVNYEARVFLNGEEVGRHEGGYTEFVLDVTGRLKPGDNHLVVRVDNRATTIQFPPYLGYFNYGGIHRDVTLEIADGPVLDDITVTATPAGTCGQLAVSGVVLNAEEGLTVRVECEGCNFATSVSENGQFTCTLEARGVAAWSPDNAVLYNVSVTLKRADRALDEETYACGFRKIEMGDGQILLNGQPLKLKGICYVYDSPAHGLVMTGEQVDEDISLLKELGVNAVRLHYPMDRLFYEACDRAGLLLWVEPPIYCVDPADETSATLFSHPQSIALARQMLTEMVTHSRNHPSVAIYGIGNECETSHPDAPAFFGELSVHLRTLDPTRLVSYAALYGKIGPLAQDVDVIGINSYWGWYDKIFGGKGLQPEKGEATCSEDEGTEPIDLAPMRKMLDEALKKDADVPLLLTEFGADSVSGFHSRGRDLWSEEYHAALLREVFKLADEYPQIIGTFPFCFTDYRDPSKIPTGYWNEMNLKGVVTHTRKKKLPFFTLRDIYHGSARLQAEHSGIR